MKKPLLLLGALLATACADPTAAQAADGTATWTDDQAEAFASFFDSPLRSVSTITPNYSAFTIDSFTAIEEVSDVARSSRLSAAGETLISNDIDAADGNVTILSLSISNEVIETAVIDDSYNPVPFAGQYDSGYLPLASLDSASELGKYFDLAQDENGYTLTGKPSATGLLSEKMGQFLFTINPYNFDALSSTKYVDNVVIKTDEAGIPSHMDFRFVNADRYGAMSESYSVELTALEKVTTLSPAAPKMTEEDAAPLDAALDKLVAAIAGLNFTTHITIDSSQMEEPIFYNSYYAYDSDLQLMLSDNEQADASYGATYTGMAYLPFAGGYVAVGVSPSVDYAANLNQDVLDLDTGAVPNIGMLNSDLFAKDESVAGRYVFDLDSFAYNDYGFCFDAMEALFGAGDWLSRSSGRYLGDSSTFEFDFHSIAIEIDDAGYPVLTLGFSSDTYGYDATSTISFSDFGTTNLESVAEFVDNGVIETFKNALHTEGE